MTERVTKMRTVALVVEERRENPFWPAHQWAVLADAPNLRAGETFVVYRLDDTPWEVGRCVPVEWEIRPAICVWLEELSRTLEEGDAE